MPAFLLLLFALTANANIFSELLRPPGESTVTTKSEVQLTPAKSIATINSGISFFQARTEFSIPVVNKAANQSKIKLQTDALSFSANKEFALPGGIVFPQRSFYNPGIGFNTVRTRESGDRFGGALTINSPSDKPFAKYDLLSVSVNSFYLLQSKPKRYWGFLLTISNNRGNLSYIPLPGVFYFVVFSRDTQLAIGLPLLYFRQVLFKKLELSVFAVFPYTLRTQLTWRPIRYINPFLFAQTKQDNYFRSNRLDHQDRLFFQRKEAGGGLTLPISRYNFMQLLLAYRFDRKLFESDSSRDKSRGVVSFADGLSYGFNINAKF